MNGTPLSMRARLIYIALAATKLTVKFKQSACTTKLNHQTAGELLRMKEERMWCHAIESIAASANETANRAVRDLQ